MSTVRLRHVAQINPPCPAFDRLSPTALLSFLPMESVWPGDRLDLGATRTKVDVATGYTRFQNGDVLVPKITPTFEASRSVIVSGLLNGVGAGTTELHVVRSGPNLDPRYLLYTMHSREFLNLGEAEMYGVAGQKRVPDDFLRNFDLALPSKEEQRRVSDFLDAETVQIDRLASAKSTLQRLLLERRSAAIHEAVTGQGHLKQVASTLPWVVSLPSDWKEVRLSLVAEMGSGHTPSRSHPEWWIDCTIPWITTGEVAQLRDDRQEFITDTREKISELGLVNSSAELKPAGTVVLCRTAASAGFSAIMGTEMATSQDFVTWTCGPLLEPAYLLWTLRAMRPDLLDRLAMGSTHKTIYVPDLQSLRIPLPPVSEQRRIIEKVRGGNQTLDGLVDRLNRQLSLLAERRQALITAAVTGQIDVTTAGRAAVG